jgi:hypothetical protein
MTGGIMPKYKVLSPIEKNGTLYVPEGADFPKTWASGGHGKLIPVDRGGAVELTEDEAAVMVYGQVPLYQGKPDSIDGAEFRAKQAREREAAEAAKAAAEKAEYEEFQAFRAAKATKKKS